MLSIAGQHLNHSTNELLVQVDTKQSSQQLGSRQDVLPAWNGLLEYDGIQRSYLEDLLETQPHQTEKIGMGMDCVAPDTNCINGRLLRTQLTIESNSLYSNI